MTGDSSSGRGRRRDYIGYRRSSPTYAELLDILKTNPNTHLVHEGLEGGGKTLLACARRQIDPALIAPFIANVIRNDERDQTEEEVYDEAVATTMGMAEYEAMEDEGRWAWLTRFIIEVGAVSVEWPKTGEWLIQALERWLTMTMRHRQPGEDTLFVHADLFARAHAARDVLAKLSGKLNEHHEEELDHIYELARNRYLKKSQLPNLVLKLAKETASAIAAAKGIDLDEEDKQPLCTSTPICSDNDAGSLPKEQNVLSEAANITMLEEEDGPSSVHRGSLGLIDHTAIEKDAEATLVPMSEDDVRNMTHNRAFKRQTNPDRGHLFCMLLPIDQPCLKLRRPGVLRIGRKPSCDIVLNGKRAPRRMADVVADAGADRASLVLRSQRGAVFVNGERFMLPPSAESASVKLLHDDVLTFAPGNGGLAEYLVQYAALELMEADSSAKKRCPSLKPNMNKDDGSNGKKDDSNGKDDGSNAKDEGSNGNDKNRSNGNNVKDESKGAIPKAKKSNETAAVPGPSSGARPRLTRAGAVDEPPGRREKVSNEAVYMEGMDQTFVDRGNEVRATAESLAEEEAKKKKAKGVPFESSQCASELNAHVGPLIDEMLAKPDNRRSSLPSISSLSKVKETAKGLKETAMKKFCIHGQLSTDDEPSCEECEKKKEEEDERPDNPVKKSYSEGNNKRGGGAGGAAGLIARGGARGYQMARLWAELPDAPVLRQEDYGGLMYAWMMRLPYSRQPGGNLDGLIRGTRSNTSSVVLPDRKSPPMWGSDKRSGILSYVSQALSDAPEPIADPPTMAGDFPSNLRDFGAPSERSRLEEGSRIPLSPATNPTRSNSPSVTVVYERINSPDVIVESERIIRPKGGKKKDE